MTKWPNESALVLERKAVERLRRFPREPDLLIYGLRSLVALLIRGLLRAYNRFEIIGAENLPNNESFILVANHSSHLDTLCLLAALPLRRLHCAFPVAAEDYFFQSLPRTWFAAVVVNALPFARRMRVRESLSICSEVLAHSGNILIIFPEGTRSRTGKMQTFRSGIGALLAGRDVTVLPCYVQGTFHAWPKGRRLPRPGKVRLLVGQPRNYSSRRVAKSDFSAIASELHRAVQELGRTALARDAHSSRRYDATQIRGDSASSSNA